MTAPARIAALALLVVVLGACKEDQDKAPPPVRPVLSTVAVVQTTDRLGPFVGTIEPRYKTDLGFRIFGRMVARFAEVGQVITKDQEIAALDPAVQALAVRSAEASLSSAEAQFANAEAEEARQKDLVQRNIIPQAQYDLTRRNLETATANLTRARASLRKANDAFSYTRLRADFDGVVTAKWAEPGQVLNAGQKVITLARPEVREAVIAIPDRLAEKLSHATDFTITVDLDHVVSMKAAGVRAIDPIADSNTRTRNVYLTLNDPPTAFRLGITVYVTFSQPVPPHVDLPETALLNKDGKSFVWVVDPAKSTVSQREVTVGARESDNVTITSGISAGERIVIAGVHSLTAGQAVKAPQ
jgi:membrane fusion protein, multidrug efflux system